MKKIKKNEFAGSFYPNSPNELKRLFSSFETIDTAIASEKIKAIIVPHAGYIYSGNLAHNAYQKIATTSPKTLIVIAPSHNYSFDGIATTDHDGFETPFGVIESNNEFRDQLLATSSVKLLNQAFSPEHSFETQLPFIKYFLPNATIIPLISGHTNPQELAHIFDLPQTLIVVSSDLSHFHSYNKAVKVDQQTKELITNYKYKQISSEMACGHLPIKGLLCWAEKHQHQIDCLELKNSGDTQGDKSSVVGYGSFIVSQK